MENNSNVIVERYLNSVYLSLAKPVEITFKDGSIADGLFGGLDYRTGSILIRNFCIYGSIEMELEKQLNMVDLKFFVVKKIELSSLPKRHTVSATKKKQAKLDVNKTQEREENLKASVSSIKKLKKQGKKSGSRDKPAQPVKNIHKNEFGFLTDKEISNKNTINRAITSNSKSENRLEDKQKNKVFEKWKPELEVIGVELQKLDGLETLDKFDQFELNKLINKEKIEEYDEEHYNTKLRLEDFTEEEIRMADQLAKEIINAESIHGINTNHILEERGLKALADNDNEEALYSAVVDSSYTFKFKNTNPVAKRKGFYERIIENWERNKRKTSELIETLSKPIDNKNSNHISNSLHPNSNGSFKTMYVNTRENHFSGMYVSVN